MLWSVLIPGKHKTAELNPVFGGNLLSRQEILHKRLQPWPLLHTKKMGVGMAADFLSRCSHDALYQGRSVVVRIRLLVIPDVIDERIARQRWISVERPLCRQVAQQFRSGLVEEESDG